MIKHVKGDLLDFYERGEINVLAHCCNNKGVMGSGVALQIKQRFPEAYQAYKEYENDHGDLNLGTISMACDETGHKMIINLHAQDGYGYQERYVDYEALYTSMEKTKSVMLKYGFNTIGFPHRVASDRAGGDWRIVLAMIEVVFEDMNVLIVEWNKN